MSYLTQTVGNLAIKLDPVEHRKSCRTRDYFALLVKGYDVDGRPVSEMVQPYDMSEGGVSFFFRAPIAVGSTLLLKLAYLAEEHSWPFRMKTKARVVRTSQTETGESLVAVCFEEGH
jgi:PilZ domain-containing protein